MTALPRISCLQLTRDRLVFAKQAIACYLRQTYPERELVVVASGSRRTRAALARHVAALGRADIRVVEAGGDLCLGALRNISLDAARGDLFCQWDDDDLHHPERLRLQYEALAEAGAQASYLSDVLQLFTHERRLHWLDWTRLRGVRRDEHWIPGTVLARREDRFRYPESGEGSQVAEDNALRRILAREAEVAVPAGSGWAYVYRYHGGNTFDRRHHDLVTSWGLTTADWVRERLGDLRSALGAYPLPLPITVAARDVAQVLVYGG